MLRLKSMASPHKADLMDPVVLLTHMMVRLFLLQGAVAYCTAIGLHRVYLQYSKYMFESANNKVNLLQSSIRSLIRQLYY